MEEVKYYGCIAKNNKFEHLPPEILEMCFNRVVVQYKPGHIRLFSSKEFEKFLEKISNLEKGTFIKRYICNTAVEVGDEESLYMAIMNIIRSKDGKLTENTELSLRFAVFDGNIDIMTVLVNDHSLEA